ncbi:MAG: GNAT family N-acetyltransferase [Arcobacteraceae bacterium]|nr:GNAT family N-acetyltransferase [Arcobacteraceae bacterium]
MYKIRNASINDYETLVDLLIEAMGDIAYYLSGTSNQTQMRAILIYYYKSELSRISYKNCFVIEKESVICGVILCYSGNDIEKLDNWTSEQIFKNFNTKVVIDKECFEDEFYIDCICVDSHYRGKKISALLFAHAINHAKKLGFDKVSLIVDIDKEATKKYYHSLGFEENTQLTINKHIYYHMRKCI